MRITVCSAIAALALVGACGGDGDSSSGPENFFEPKPECEGAPITALSGQHQMVMSYLQIGAAEDGFDLDGDGVPNNKMSAIGGLTKDGLDEGFTRSDIVIPFEFFDMDEVAVDDCVKFAVYAGNYHPDRDDDGEGVALNDGDCNDFDPNVGRKAVEVPDNGKDDDCDGLADELEEVTADGFVQTPSNDVLDRDKDGVTIADGDCDDTNPAVTGGAREVCGDGFDNNCDGAADWALVDAVSGKSQCSPYDDELEQLFLEPFSFTADGEPAVAFNNGSIVEEVGQLKLSAGPSKFSVIAPIDGDLNLELRISGARIEGDLVMTPMGWAIDNGRLGGVLDANGMDNITGLKADEVGLSEDDTLLDATYANILGTLLALKRLGGDSEWADCRTPDVDVDGDGIEAFCDTNTADEVNRVDACIDGDGTVYFDEVDAQGNVTTQCTDFTGEDGRPLFMDGISIEMNFRTTPALLPTEYPL